MVKVSVVIPTHNRPQLLQRAIASVLAQTFQDVEIIVVDDGKEKSAEHIVHGFHDLRIVYCADKKEQGGAAARNVGIVRAKGDFIAFLDDDDEWLENKLQIQMSSFEKTPQDVGFCFSAVINAYDDKEEATEVNGGIKNYFEIALTRFKGFLTSTLIVKKNVFLEIGYFDEALPSHQEPDLILRMSRKYKGLGMNIPLVKMTMLSGHDHIGGNLNKKIAGREFILNKYADEFKKRPRIFARHYFWLALMYRNNKDYIRAQELFKKAMMAHFQFRYLFHYLSISFMPRTIKQFLLSHEPFKPQHMGPWIRTLYFEHYLPRFVNFSLVKKALDAGCGHGAYAQKIADRVPQGRVAGCDILEFPEWHSRTQQNLEFRKADLQSLNEKNVYDLIVSIDSLEHIPDNKEVLKKFYDALRSGGFLYVAVPCTATEWNILPEKWFSHFHEWEEHEHIGEQYTLNELTDILKTIGFTVIFSRHTFTFWGHLSWEIEFLLRGSKTMGRINILLMPILKLLGLLDLLLPFGKGNNLIIAKKSQ